MALLVIVFSLSFSSCPSMFCLAEVRTGPPDQLEFRGPFGAVFNRKWDSEILKGLAKTSTRYESVVVVAGWTHWLLFEFTK